MKRILILYTSYGTGHFQAAKALEKGFLNTKEKVRIEVLDPLSYSRPIINKIFSKIGNIFGTKLRSVRGRAYDKLMYKNYLKRNWFPDFCIRLFWTKELEKKIVSFNPDLIVSTQVGPTGLLAYHNHRHGIEAKLVSVFTDYGLHRWYVIPHAYIDMYYAPNFDVKNKMIELGINSNKIMVTGIPVKKEFYHNDINIDLIKKRYSLKNAKKIVLFVCGGGLGYSNAYYYFEKLLEIKNDFSYIFVSGKNKDLYTYTKKLSKKSNKKGVVLPYVNNMAELMKISDVVVGKPGGILTSECIAMKKPFIAIMPIPGQETQNVKHIVDSHFGIYASNKKEFMKIMTNVTDEKNNYLEIFANALENNELQYATERIVDNSFKIMINDYDNIDLPEELLEYMNENIEYGYIAKNGWIFNSNDKNYDKSWPKDALVQAGYDVIKTKYGTSYDQVELEREWFIKHNYQIKTIFMTFNKDYKNSLPNHTFLAFFENNKWYWFEHAYIKQKGIHEFDTFDDLLKNAKEKLMETAIEENNATKNDKIFLKCYEYEKPEPNIGVEDYLEYIMKKEIK